MEKLKAVAYCRVSTIMQEEGRSLEFQIKKCQDYCEFQNYELIEIIQDVESGGNDDREELNKLFKLLIDKILILNKNEINVYNKEIKMSINIK